MIYIFQAWRDQLQKAKELYEEAKSLTAASLRIANATLAAAASASSSSAADQLYYTAAYHGEIDQLNLVDGGDAAGGIRRGSFRGYKLSSIGHSYSGSMDMSNEISSSSPHAQSSPVSTVTS